MMSWFADLVPVVPEGGSGDPRSCGAASARRLVHLRAPWPALRAVPVRRRPPRNVERRRRDRAGPDASVDEICGATDAGTRRSALQGRGIHRFGEPTKELARPNRESGPRGQELMSATMPTAHLIHGYIGAGKTTFAKRIEQDAAAVRFSADEWLTTLYGDDEAEIDVGAITDRLLIAMEPVWSRCLKRVTQPSSSITFDATMRSHGAASRVATRIRREAFAWCATPSMCSRRESNPSDRTSHTSSSRRECQRGWPIFGGLRIRWPTAPD
ncbi:AAA family ATPase [Actinopolymorpha alba]|uniref:AAA family ATPase n=1 Tax=Actinopolymorpha alba TaxID=533267 RepID=UPI000A01EC9C